MLGPYTCYRLTDEEVVSADLLLREEHWWLYQSIVTIIYYSLQEAGSPHLQKAIEQVSSQDTDDLSNENLQRRSQVEKKFDAMEKLEKYEKAAQALHTSWLVDSSEDDCITPQQHMTLEVLDLRRRLVEMRTPALEGYPMFTLCLVNSWRWNHYRHCLSGLNPVSEKLTIINSVHGRIYMNDVPNTDFDALASCLIDWELEKLDPEALERRGNRAVSTVEILIYELANLLGRPIQSLDDLLKEESLVNSQIRDWYFPKRYWYNQQINGELLNRLKYSWIVQRIFWYFNLLIPALQSPKGPSFVDEDPKKKLQDNVDWSHPLLQGDNLLGLDPWDVYLALPDEDIRFLVPEITQVEGEEDLYEVKAHFLEPPPCPVDSHAPLIATPQFVQNHPILFHPEDEPMSQ